jgi:hypothetical protein
MAPIVLVVCLAAGRGGGEALRRAHKSGMVDSARVHGCDFANGWVYVDGRCQRAQDSGAPPELDRARGFSFGVATSAYQIEGGAALGGRGPSIWDTFSHTPGATANGETGDVAVDHYHRWEEDLALVKALGVDTYRMSIAWPRVMPDGVTLNPEGVAFYQQLFDRLIADGIAPMVTLYHWDLPQALEDRGGWRNKTMIVPAFAAYAKAMFRAFGGKVKMWATFNEPATFVFIGAARGRGGSARARVCSLSASLSLSLSLSLPRSRPLLAPSPPARRRVSPSPPPHLRSRSRAPRPPACSVRPRHRRARPLLAPRALRGGRLADRAAPDRALRPRRACARRARAARARRAGRRVRALPRGHGQLHQVHAADGRGGRSGLAGSAVAHGERARHLDWCARGRERERARQAPAPAARVLAPWRRCALPI